MTTTASPLAEALREQIKLRPGERLYGIVDAAQDKELAFEARDHFKLPIRMLFQGEVAEYMGDVAPYLIPIDPAGEYLECWAERWGKNAGILLTTSADPVKLFRHLREIFVVKDEEGQEYFFRYYDPRVLRTYLPTCTDEEAKEFFGPVGSFLIESENMDSLQKLVPGEAGGNLGAFHLSTHNCSPCKIYIRQEQCDKLAEATFETYILAIRKKLSEPQFAKSRERWFSCTGERQALDSVIRQLIDEGEQLGFVCEGDVAPYVLLAFSLVELCQDNDCLGELIKAIIVSKETLAEERMDAIYELLPEQERLLIFDL